MDISRNNILAVVGAIVSVGAVLVSVTIVVQTVRAVAEQAARDVASLSAAVAAADARIDGLQQADVRAEERYTTLLAVLRRLDSRVGQLEAGTPEN